MMYVARTGRRDAGGQALVEFSLAIIVFLMLLLALFDFGRAIFMNNGLSEAAREVARAASVAQGTTGYSTSAQATINTQKAMVPGLTVLDPVCVTSANADDSSAVPGPCGQDTFLVVTTRATYTPVSLLGMLGTIQLQAKSRIQVPLSQNK